MSKQNINKQDTWKKDSGLERFLMNVADNAEAALREYLQERDSENRRYATEYVTRRGLLPQ